MFGITPQGWLHTVGSLPAIPLAIYMLVRHGRITPRSKAGTAYLIFMTIGAATIFLVAHMPASYVIGVATLFFLALGFGAGHMSFLGRAGQYIETISLSVTVFLLMVPAVSETLRRVPDGHPFVRDLQSPLLLGVQGALFILLIVGSIMQFRALRKAGTVT
jgi:hypothetical protein